MGNDPNCTIAYGWLVDHSVLDKLTQALPPEQDTNPPFFPEELWGWYEEVHAIGWEKNRFSYTEEIEDIITINEPDKQKLKLFREWLVNNQSDWDKDTEEVFKMIMTTPPKLLAICNYS